jgi:hypothetical protein
MRYQLSALYQDDQDRIAAGQVPQHLFSRWCKRPDDVKVCCRSQSWRCGTLRPMQAYSAQPTRLGNLHCGPLHHGPLND